MGNLKTVEVNLIIIIIIIIIKSNFGERATARYCHFCSKQSGWWRNYWFWEILQPHLEITPVDGIPHGTDVIVQTIESTLDYWSTQCVLNNILKDSILDWYDTVIIL
jgi:hypothetical protein